MCRLHHKGCAFKKHGCKSRQDIYEKLCFKVQKRLQITAVPKGGLRLYSGKMKIGVPTSPQGVAKTKPGLRKQPEHLRKTRVNEAETIVETMVNNNVGQL